MTTKERLEHEIAGRVHDLPEPALQHALEFLAWLAEAVEDDPSLSGLVTRDLILKKALTEGEGIYVPDRISGDEMMRIAAAGGSFDWLKGEPDLYTTDDLAN